MSERKFKCFSNLLLQRDVSGYNLNILQIALAELAPNWVNPNARQPYVRLYYIQSGCAEIYYRDKRIKMLPGNIYLIPSELDFGYFCDDICYKLFCTFTFTQYDQRDLYAGINECIILQDRPDTVNTIIELFKKGDPESCLRIKMILFNTACEGLLAANRFSCSNEFSPIIKSAIEYISHHRRIDLSIYELAKQLNTSPSTLRKYFRREMGISFGQYVFNEVLAEVDKELRITNRSIQEISEAYGFSDPSYFSRAYKRYFHFPPSVARKNTDKGEQKPKI